MAMADGYIGSWEAKFHYRYWRPVTAIQSAATDGNPDTEADVTWTPLQQTIPCLTTTRHTASKVAQRRRS
jgi:hypothetical protein